MKIAAAYMNKIAGEKRSCAPWSNISGFIAVSRLARWEKRHLHLKKAARPYFGISHCHNIHIKLPFLLLAISLLFTGDFFTVSAASLNSDSSLSEIKPPIPDTCKLLKVNKKMPRFTSFLGVHYV